MIFEKQLGISPADWLRYEPLDQFLNANVVPVLPLEESISLHSGIHLSLLRLIIATFLSIVAGVVHRYVPSATGARPVIGFCQVIRQQSIFSRIDTAHVKQGNDSM